jgi:hypothetical protein
LPLQPRFSDKFFQDVLSETEKPVMPRRGDKNIAALAAEWELLFLGGRSEVSAVDNVAERRGYEQRRDV